MILRSIKVTSTFKWNDWERVRTGNVTHLVVVEDGLATGVASHIRDGLVSERDAAS
jgi:hypothetical protein